MLNAHLGSLGKISTAYKSFSMTAYIAPKRAHTSSVHRRNDMKGLVWGMAIGMVAGMVLSEVPEVKQMLGKGKRTLKDMTK